MRIADHGIHSVPNTRPLGRAADTQPPQMRPAGESVQLSAAANLMLTARQALRDTSEVREQQVREFGRQLALGRYRSDPEAIASAMIAD